MNLRDLKSLNSIISEVTEPETQDKSRMIQEGFGNSLSAKARQVVDEQVEGSRGPNPQGKPVKVKPATGSVGIEANRIKASGEAEVARLARKALKRAKKKAATNEEAELDLDEGSSLNFSLNKIKFRRAKIDDNYRKAKAAQAVKPVKPVKPASGGITAFRNRATRQKRVVIAPVSSTMAEEWDEVELDLAEGVNAKRLRVLRKHVKDGANPMSPEVKDFMARSFKKTTNANKTRIAPGGSAVKAMEVRMRNKHSAMKEKGLAESDQLDELSDNTLFSARYKAHTKGRTRLTGKIDNELIKRKLLAPPTTSMRERDAQYMAHRDANRTRLKAQGMQGESNQLDELSPALLGRYIQRATHDSANAAYRAGKLNKPRKQSKEEDALIKKVFKREKGIGRAAWKLISDKHKVTESDQLDEAGYKRLMRIKKAAYKADLDSRGSSPSDPTLTGPFGRRYKQEKKHSRLTRAAAELTTKVAANMARRGGASADAVRGDGSLMGKRGTFSQKAIKLSNQRDKALAKFRGRAAEGKRWASSYPTADKRAAQQRNAKFDNQSRSGDFGQDNQAAMRKTYNYLKRTGKISEELAGLIEAAPKKALPKPKKKSIVKKPIVAWSAYDKWKKRLSPAAAAKENKRIADAHKLFKLSRSEKEVAKRNEQGQSGSGRGGFDGGHGPSPGSRWI